MLQQVSVDERKKILVLSIEQGHLFSVLGDNKTWQMYIDILKQRLVGLQYQISNMRSNEATDYREMYGRIQELVSIMGLPQEMVNTGKRAREELEKLKKKVRPRG